MNDRELYVLVKICSETNCRVLTTYMGNLDNFGWKIKINGFCHSIWEASQEIWVVIGVNAKQC